MTYYELYNLPVSFLPDGKTVREKFYELSRKYHPDFFSNGTEDEQNQALETSSLINKAYKTFLNKDASIRYLLMQKNLLQEEEKYSLPKDFLMEMLEMNEALADAKMEDDNAKLNDVKKQLSMIQTEIYEPVKEIVEHYQEGIVSEKELLRVKEYYFKKKYLSRILESME